MVVTRMVLPSGFVAKRDASCTNILAALNYARVAFWCYSVAGDRAFLCWFCRCACARCGCHWLVRRRQAEAVDRCHLRAAAVNRLGGRAWVALHSQQGDGAPARGIIVALPVDDVLLQTIAKKDNIHEHLGDL